VVDPTGAFVSYAGQYQPDAAAFFERTDPPAFVALTGKARTFQPEDGDRVYTSVRPESVSAVDAETRDRWTVSAAEATLRRVAAMADALSMDQRGDDLEAALLDRGYDASLAAGIPIALDHYGTTVAYLDAIREMALDALEVVAGDRDEVRALDVAPDDAGTTSLGPLPEAVQRAVETAADAPEPTPDESGTVTADEGADATADAASEPTTAATATGESTTSATDDDPTDGASVAADATSDDAETAPEPVDDTPSNETPPDTATDDGLGNFDDGLDSFDDDDDLYELDEEERREVEAEFDVGFESGAEVGDPGEAGIDVPGPEDLDEGTAEPSADAAETAAADTAEASAVAETATNDDAGDAVADTEAETSAVDVDLEDAAVDAMSDLDDGDGALHDEVVAAVVDEYGADPGAVADAIEDALMSGKCYEPSEDRLKAI
jgi:hypothetical protein